MDSSVFTVTANDGQGKPLGGAAVTVNLTMPSMEMPKNEIVCQETKPGEYTGKGRFTMSGDWRAHVTVKSAGRMREQNVPLTVK
ncbi:hypothetical protein CCAX7_52890 [Capsulimonas corticalis]|uniref:YtkA-like domain-containing protein n=1 Tax=Capsulimonas corticalis TaxID=2219043 RepID=A0A402CP08_9BACT|nr:hypothetical protein CCAX7_52890 [Capsulimonas corticalis]